MKTVTDIVTQFNSLRVQLLKEKARLEASLAEISKVLGAGAAVSVAAPAAPPKRVFSAVTRARMAKSQQARWAAKNAKLTTKLTPTAGPGKQEKRKSSAESREKNRAASLAWWAKVRAEKAAKAQAGTDAPPVAQVPPGGG